MSDNRRQELAAELEELTGIVFDPIPTKEEQVGSIERAHVDKIILPQEMSLDDAYQVLKAENDSQTTNFMREFQFRPWDVAYAATTVMERDYGTLGTGAAIQTMFGPIPPQRITVHIGPGKTAQVLWGKIRFLPLRGSIVLEQQRTKRGPLGWITIEAPASMADKADEFFDRIQKQLEEHSIYRGQSFDGQDMPEFIDLSGVNPSQIVYNDDTLAALKANLWTPIRHADTLRKMGKPVKRRVLMEGPFGSGKTMTALRTAQIANENGFTFIYCRPQDNLRVVMETAQLYAPAIVFYEDIDRIQAPAQVLLDVFDGIKAKSADVIAVATTNHVDKVEKGMLRPGRFDAVIHVGACDAKGAQRLIRGVLGDSLLSGVAVAEVAEALDGMTPAFVREAIDRALLHAVSREGGEPQSLLTSDLLFAVNELRRQNDLMEAAQEEQQKPEFTDTFERMIRDSIHGVKLVYNQDDDQVIDGSTICPVPGDETPVED